MLALLALLAGPPQPAAPRDDFDRRRVIIHRTGMATLTGWSLANIGLGLGLGFTTEGPARHFHQMNAYWNTVNLALGIAGLVGLRRESRGRAASDPLAMSRRSASLFTWNAALDVAYMATGAILYNFGQDRDHDRMLGYGAAIVLQGGFLFVFDLTMAALHTRNLQRRAPKPTASITPGGAVFSLRGTF